MLAKYDAMNPRPEHFLAAKTKVLPFSQAVMDASFKASMEVWPRTTPRAPSGRRSTPTCVPSSATRSSGSVLPKPATTPSCRTERSDGPAAVACHRASRSETRLVRLAGFTTSGVWGWMLDPEVLPGGDAAGSHAIFGQAGAQIASLLRTGMLRDRSVTLSASGFSGPLRQHLRRSGLCAVRLVGSA